MITRQRDINPKAKEVKLAICLGQPDAKTWLQNYLKVFSSSWSAEQAKSLEFTEPDMRKYIENNLLVLFEQKWARQVSAWGWAQWVALGFLTSSSTRDGIYFLTEKGLALVRWQPFVEQDP